MGSNKEGYRQDSSSLNFVWGASKPTHISTHEPPSAEVRRGRCWYPGGSCSIYLLEGLGPESYARNPPPPPRPPKIGGSGPKEPNTP